MTEPATSTPLAVFPVGHYTGTLYPGVGEPLQYHSVRIGRITMTIPDEHTFAVWAAGHRPPDQADKRWTAEDVLRTAAELGAPDPAAILAEFLDEGLLAEVETGTDDAVGFAEAHRVVPLMVGLGNTPDDPLTYGIGLFGAVPILRVPSLVYDVWQWSSVGDNLWKVCQAFAQSSLEAGVEDVQEHDPKYVLDVFLNSLQNLLGFNAAYLDEARSE